MNHLLIFPILVPLVTGITLLLAYRQSTLFHRLVSVTSTLVLTLIGTLLVAQADTGIHQVYALGNWPAPFGIMLVLDRLSALMVLLTAIVALLTSLYACSGSDREGPHFHTLFQFQLMGLNGAFLTGDLFNLFVFFEVLLIASYTLLLHGGGKSRSGSAMHYVALNLLNSLLFLIALGTLYGTLGTLNMADMASAVTQADPADLPLIQTGGLLLLVVFTLKAAMLPLLFWLPWAYSSAPAPVAALFAIMTKVGVYSIVRVYTLVFGPLAGDLANLAEPWLWPLSLATIGIGALGAFSASHLRVTVAWLVVLSAGTLLATFSLGNADSLAALLYYTLHTTFATAALFLLAGLIRSQRGSAEDALVAAPPMHRPWALGVLFIFAAMAVIGLPPFSGFVAKLLILASADTANTTFWLWTLVLGGGLLVLITLSRAGSTLFWKHSEGTFREAPPLEGAALVATVAMVALSPALALWGEPVADYAAATAEQLQAPQAYIDAVLGVKTIGATEVSP
ncbi:monovalent cation/H+ antiporter subunit D [Marinobacteraceae bacterium S3BR75-40.1]